MPPEKQCCLTWVEHCSLMAQQFPGFKVGNHCSPAHTHNFAVRPRFQVSSTDLCWMSKTLWPLSFIRIHFADL